MWEKLQNRFSLVFSINTNSWYKDPLCLELSQELERLTMAAHSFIILSYLKNSNINYYVVIHLS